MFMVRGVARWKAGRSCKYGLVLVCGAVFLGPLSEMLLVGFARGFWG